MRIDFLPDHAPGWLLEAKRNQPRIGLRKVLPLSDRLAITLSERIGLVGDLGNQSDKALRTAENALRSWPFLPNGSEGFAKAEVTAGGISTADLSSQTMEARRVPGLMRLAKPSMLPVEGGYNFQWAWASAHAAGSAL